MSPKEQQNLTLYLDHLLKQEPDAFDASVENGKFWRTVASTWVRETYGEPCRSLVEQAESWQYGKTLATDKEVKGFIEFAAQETGIAAR